MYIDKSESEHNTIEYSLHELSQVDMEILLSATSEQLSRSQQRKNYVSDLQSIKLTHIHKLLNDELELQ